MRNITLCGIGMHKNDCIMEKIRAVMEKHSTNRSIQFLYFFKKMQDKKRTGLVYS